MTVQAGVEISLELLVGEFEEQACESVSHESHWEVHSGAATHYAKIDCPSCGYSAVKAYCQPFADLIQGSGPILCFCGIVYPAHLIAAVLAPITH